MYVVGDVQRAGAYDVSSLSTPLNALYEAGGPTSAGSMRLLKHNRGTAWKSGNGLPVDEYLSATGRREASGKFD